MRIIIIILLMALTACSSNPKSVPVIDKTIIDKPFINTQENTEAITYSYQENKVKPLSDKFSKLNNLLHRLGENPGKEELEGMSRQVNDVIKIFQGRKHKWFQRSLNRAQKYLPMIREVMNEKQMPEEIAYLAMVESGFMYNAGSHAGAVGIWQFMRGTAKDYGLRVGRKIDERRDPLLSTYAAREYLLDLVAIYGSDSILLAMASYNAGEGRVQRALRKLKNPFEERSFFHLQAVLPKETRLYVPQILAAALIAAEPEKYGFSTPSQKHFAYILVNKRTSLKTLANKMGLSETKLKRLNDDLSKKSKRTPVNHYVLKVPANKSVKLLTYLGSKTRWWSGSSYQNIKPQLMAVNDSMPVKSYIAEIKQETLAENSSVAKQKVKKQPAVKPGVKKASIKTSIKTNIKIKRPAGKYIRYKVQSGNSINDIAGWFNTTVKQLKLWNPQYRSKKPAPGDIVMVYGLPQKQQKNTHKVKPGESLWTISGFYDVDIKRIAQWNGLQKRVIYPDQKLVIYSYKKDYKKTDKKRQAKNKKYYKVIYQVKKNNHLSGIATLFNVSIREIKKWNQLAGGRIYQGQKLKLFLTEAKRKKYYRIKKGDTLGKIAQQLKYSQDQLAFINGIKSRKAILKGQQLVYYR